MKKINIITKLWEKFYYDILSVICAIYFPIGLLFVMIIIHQPDKTLLSSIVALSVALAAPRAIVFYSLRDYH